jgi:hypothetical protein
MEGRPRSYGSENLENTLHNDVNYELLELIGVLFPDKTVEEIKELATRACLFSP